MLDLSVVPHPVPFPPFHFRRICQAITFLDDVKTSPNGWVACAQRFLAGNFEFEGTKFQCLVVIEDAIRSKYESTSNVDVSPFLVAMLSRVLPSQVHQQPHIGST